MSKDPSNVEIVMPKLNDAGDAGQVDEIIVKVGDTVAAGDAVMTVEMEKAVIDIESTGAGTVKRIDVAPGDTVEVDRVLMELHNPEPDDLS